MLPLEQQQTRQRLDRLLARVEVPGEADVRHRGENHLKHRAQGRAQVQPGSLTTTKPLIGSATAVDLDRRIVEATHRGGDRVCLVPQDLLSGQVV